MHDGPFESRLPGESTVDVQCEKVAGKPEQQRLVLGRMPGDDHVRRPLWHHERRGRGIRPAESAVEA